MVEWVIRDSFELTGEYSPAALEQGVEYADRTVGKLIPPVTAGRRPQQPEGLPLGVPQLLRSHDERELFESAVGPMPTVLVCRDPVDSLVSLFHFRRDHRQAFEGTLSESIRTRSQGPARLARWYNSWGTLDDALVVTYERMRRDTVTELGLVLWHLDLRTDRPLQDVVDIWSFDRRVRNAQGSGAGGGLRAAQVGGGRSEMSEQDQAYVWAELDRRLDRSGRALMKQAGYEV